MMWDVYSGVIRSIYKRYSEHDPSSFLDWEVLCDYKDVERGIGSNIADDARAMAEELEVLLEAEIKRRMNKWRKMANRATAEFYDMLTREETEWRK